MVPIQLKTPAVFSQTAKTYLLWQGVSASLRVMSTHTNNRFSPVVIAATISNLGFSKKGVIKEFISSEEILSTENFSLGILNGQTKTIQSHNENCKFIVRALRGAKLEIRALRKDTRKQLRGIL
jgi:hypothetical protein